MYTPVNPSFTKWGLKGSKLYRLGFVMNSVDPDEIAIVSRLARIYTICKSICLGQ